MDIDPKIKEFVEGLLKQNPYSSDNEYSTNPFEAYKNYVILVTKRLQQVPGFIAEQSVLKSMNPLGRPVVFNPATPYGPPPGAGGFITDSLDRPISEAEFGKQKDVIKDAMQGKLISGPAKEIRGVKLLIEGKTIEQYNNQFNSFSKENPREKNSLIDLENLDQNGAQGTKVQTTVEGVDYSVPDFEKIYFSRRNGPGFGDEERGIGGFSPNPGAKFAKTQKQTRKERAIENDDVFFSKEDFEQGYVTSDVADCYIPFFFQDLRKPDRKIYFRAFLTNFTETINPQFNVENSYGRVDPIPIYKSTLRTFAIGFKIAAMSPAGFSTMWKKMNNLTKMMYPTYKNGVLNRGPILRVRIGDVMCESSGQGLAGFLSSPFELNYSDSPWEIDAWALKAPEQTQLGRAPMVIEASFGYTVIHSVNPSLDEDYNWDAGIIRGLGITTDNFDSVITDDESTNSTPSGEQ